MENTTTIPVSAQLTACRACHIDVTTDDAFCNNCGYPLKGSEEEQKNFIAQLTVNEIDLVEYHEKIKKGGNSLFWVAGAFALGLIIDLAKDHENSNVVASLIVGLIICGLFVFLGGWSRKKPFAALISGACLYAVIVILNAIINPISLIQGIIFKIAIVVCLVNGIRAAMDAEKIKKETHLS